LAACLGAALAGGVLEGVVSRWLSLLLVFPALLGGIVAFAAVRVIARSHIRAPWVAAGLAGVAGLCAQLALHGVQYAQFRSDLGSQFAESPKAGSDTAPVLDQVLEQETGQRGFAGFLLFRAKLGTEIKKAGHSSGMKLDGLGFWILFALNFLIAGGIAASSAYSRANAPYCEPCQRWYEQTQPVASGSADQASVKGTLQAMDGGVFTDVPAAFGAPQQDGVALLHLLRCAGCADHEPQLTLTVVSGAGKKQKTKQAYQGMLRSDEARSLLGAFAAAKPAAKVDGPG
jgi:hypothetical protein